jgi:hypothetical protein
MWSQLLGIAQATKFRVQKASQRPWNWDELKERVVCSIIEAVQDEPIERLWRMSKPEEGQVSWFALLPLSSLTVVTPALSDLGNLLVKTSCCLLENSAKNRTKVLNLLLGHYRGYTS